MTAKIIFYIFASQVMSKWKIYSIKLCHFLIDFNDRGLLILTAINKIYTTIIIFT